MYHTRRGEIITAVVVAVAGVVMATTLFTSQLAIVGPRFSPRAQTTAVSEVTLTSTGELTGSSNNIFTRAIELARQGVLKILAFISQLTRVPGVQKSTCDPTLPETDPASCQFQYPNLKITVIPTRSPRAQLLTTSSWSTTIENNSKDPSTPLIADVDSTSAGLEVVFIAGNGELYIYKSDGTLHASTAGSNVAGPPPNRTPEYAPTAIRMDGDATYEIIFPSSVGGVGSGTLRGYRGDGSPISGSGILATFPDNVGTPKYAAVVDDWDGDGNPEIFVTTQNPVAQTSSLLGWQAVGGILTGLHNGNPLLLQVSGTTGIPPNILPVDLLPPAIGNIDTNPATKEVVVAFEASEGNMRIYVVGKNAAAVQYLTSGTPENPPNPSGSFWYEGPINEMVSVGVEYSQLGGIALVDYNGDGKLEVIASTQKKVNGNDFGFYYVRSYTHDGATNGGVIFSPRLEIQSGFLGVSRPSIGEFDVRAGPDVVFKTVGNSSTQTQHALFAARYNSGSNTFEWILDDAENDFPTPRRIVDKEGNTCTIRLETSNSSIALGNFKSTVGANELLYSKYHSWSGPFYTLHHYAAENTVTTDLSICPSLGYRDVLSFFSGQNSSDISKPVYSLSNIELADIDDDGAPDAAFTYSYDIGTFSSPNTINTLRHERFDLGTSGLTQWGMTSGNECRQGRYQGVCPAGPGGPTFTPAPTSPIPTITPPTATSTPTPATSSTPVPTLPPGGSDLFLPLILKNSPTGGGSSKSLSTVYAIQNLDAVNPASVHVDYRRAQNDGGGAWLGVSGASTDFTIPAGKAVNIAQYFDVSMANGRGSATVTSSRAIASVVNLLARSQVPTSGSYSGFNTGAGSVSAPLVFKNLTTSAGVINSTLTIQNTGSGPTNFDIVYISGTTFLPIYTSSVSNLAAGQSYFADQALETGLPSGFFGSAVVNATSAGGLLAVVGNQFTGPDGLLTYSGFKSTEGHTGWAIPLYSCRLNNGFSSPIIVQNVSGTTIAAGAIVINFTPDPSLGATTFSVSNPTAVPNNASFVYNPRTTTTCPAGSFGSARVTAPNTIVVLVNQIQDGSAAALSYNAIPTNATFKTALSPVVFSRLPNGFSTVITVVNLDNTSGGTVTITYTPNSACVIGGVVCVSYTKVAAISAGGGFIQNHRLGESALTHPLPAGWYGSARIVSDKPIGAVVNQLELLQGGDNSLSFNAISQP